MTEAELDKCEFYVRDGVAQLEGIDVMIDGKYPRKESIHIVKNGVIFQPHCYDGLKYDVCVSWLQKSVRRGDFESAVYCAAQMIKLGRMFESHCVNRLLLMASEDIGPVEPGIAKDALNYYNHIQLHRDTNRIKTKRLFMEFIDMLCRAKKSRQGDWAYHKLSEKDVGSDSFEDAIIAAKNHHANKMGGVFVSHILKFGHPDPYGDIDALAKIYHVRKDVLALVHMAQIVYIGYGSSSVYSAANTFALLDDDDIEDLWDYHEALNLKVLDDAVDMHTKDGSKLLKRDMVHFICRGSRLKNWTPYHNEIELIREIYEESVKTLGYGRIKTDIIQRPYQKHIVDTVARNYMRQDTQILEMACGTGKTKTSWWITKSTMDTSFPMGKILVVTPLLGILSQFHDSWRDMAITDRSAIDAYVVASEFGKPVGSAYTNYTHVKNNEMLAALATDWNNPNTRGTKIMFTTYMSESRIPKSLHFDMVIYDEAHHITSSYARGIYTLKMSATLNGLADVKYSYYDAIKDGAMTDYRVRLFDGTASKILKHQNKLIVYCLTNARCHEIKSKFAGAVVVTCKTPATERDKIYQKFRESEKAVIINCRILGEGVDLPECDSVYFESGSTSYVSVIQAMGRCIRLSTGKETGYIYMNSSDVHASSRLDQMRKVDPDVDSKIEILV